MVGLFWQEARLGLAAAVCPLAGFLIMSGEVGSQDGMDSPPNGRL